MAGGGDKHRRRDHAAVPLVPGMEDMGNGHDREAGHDHSAFKGRRGCAVFRFRGTGDQQRLVPGIVDRSRDGAPVG